MTSLTAACSWSYCLKFAKCELLWQRNAFLFLITCLEFKVVILCSNRQNKDIYIHQDLPTLSVTNSPITTQSPSYPLDHTHPPTHSPTPTHSPNYPLTHTYQLTHLPIHPHLPTHPHIPNNPATHSPSPTHSPSYPLTHAYELTHTHLPLHTKALTHIHISELFLPSLGFCLKNNEVIYR